MPGTTLQSLTREELESEILRLRGEVPNASPDAHRMRAIFDSAIDFAMVVMNSDGVITDWNIGAERIMGWSADEMRGRDASRFFTPEDLANGRLAIELETALREGRVADVRWHVRKDGERFWASGEMMPLFDQRQVHIGFAKIVRDRTSEHLAMLALRQREKLRRALLELTDRFAAAENIADLTDSACALIGQTLDVKLAGYGLVDVGTETITIERDWSGNGIPSIAGALSFRDYGSYIEELMRGETVVIGDVFEDPRTSSNTAELAAINVQALVNMPVVENGQLVAVLFVCDDRPHAWGEGEINFISEVASRTRSATARAMAEQALRRSEHRLAALSHASAEVRFRVSGDWSELHELWGGSFIPNTEQVNRFWVEAYIPPSSKPAVIAEVERALRTRTPYAIEHQVYQVDGSVGWASVRAVPVFDKDGAVVEWYGAASDITGRRRAEIALQDLNATLEMQIEARTAERNRIWQVSRDMLLVSDLDGVLLAVNPAWTATLGWKEHELLGRTTEWLEPDDDRLRTRDEIDQIAQGTPSLSFENRFRTRDGHYRDLAWTAVASDDKIYAVARDVTNERAQSAVLMATEEALRQSQKMEAVGQLTGGLAHDFNNLLAGISGSLELMGLRISQGKLTSLERYISAAQGATQRAAALTHRLLAFSRRQTLAPKPTNANELIEGLADLVRRTVGPEIEMRLELCPKPWLAQVDPSQLENAVLNLCINARDAMPDGGRITITTSNGMMDASAARVRDLSPGEYLSISVTDTGTGMPSDVMAKAFEPFFTTKPIGQGTGLGLSMIYGFAKQSGGQVRIYSEVGRGTTVSIFLPRFTGTLYEETPNTALELVRPATEGETVLVIDDEPTVRLLITEVLEGLGYVAIEASDGVGGLTVLQSDTRVDLLITDVGLPGGLNGRQVADAARIKRPELKVLFITGYADASVFNHKGAPAGMQILTKPFSFDALAAKIREMLEA